VRWDELFADLEAQVVAGAVAQRADEIDERARIEFARIHLVQRLRPAVGQVIRIRCPAGVTVQGVLVRMGEQWLLVDEASGRQALVSLAGVVAVSGLGRLAAPPVVPGESGDERQAAVALVESRLGMTHALRAIARDRSAVRIELVDGSGIDGTIDRVGADFLEIAVHAAGELRRRAAVREVVIVAIAALAVVRRGSG
jgi:hypothetical protein